MAYTLVYGTDKPEEARVLDSLDQLMCAIQQGDQAALCHLMNGYRHRLECLARRVLGDDPAAEDVVQEAFAAIWQKRGSYKPGRRSWPWIARIVRNGCHQRWRRRGGRRKRVQPIDVSLELAEYLPAPQASPVADAQQSEFICLARQFIESMPPTWREVIQLSVLADMPDSEIVELLGIPPGTVKSRKHRALAALREKFADYQGDNE